MGNVDTECKSRLSSLAAQDSTIQATARYIRYCSFHECYSVSLCVHIYNPSVTMSPSPTEQLFLSHHNPAEEAIKEEAAAMSVTGPTSDTWDWKAQLNENAFSLPTAYPDVKDPFEVQECAIGLLKYNSDVTCVIFATWTPQQTRQHLIRSQLGAPYQTLLLLAGN